MKPIVYLIALLCGTVSLHADTIVARDTPSIFEVTFDYRGGPGLSRTPIGVTSPPDSTFILVDNNQGDVEGPPPNFSRSEGMPYTIGDFQVQTYFLNASGGAEVQELLIGALIAPGETIRRTFADFGSLLPFGKLTVPLPGFSELNIVITRDAAILPEIAPGDTGWRGSVQLLASNPIPDGGATWLLLALGLLSPVFFKPLTCS